MKVQDLFIKDKKRYMLVNGNIQPVIKYLKYLDSIRNSDKTLKSYCHHLNYIFNF